MTGHHTQNQWQQLHLKRFPCPGPALGSAARTSRITLAAGIAALLLSACGDSRSPEKVIQASQASYEQKDYRSAAVQLKALLQEHPDNWQARLLLGKTLLSAGDARGAAIELQKALDLGAPASEAVPPLAAAQLGLGRFQDIVASYGTMVLPGQEAQADLLTTVGTAHASTGNLDAAAARAREALERMSGHGPATVLLAQVHAARGEVDTAFDLVEKLLARMPTYQPALLLRADLLHRGRRDFAAARTAYEHAAALDPRSGTAVIGLIGVLMEQNDVAGARSAQRTLAGLAPGSFWARLFDAQLLFAEGEFEAARRTADLLLRDYPDEPRSMYVAAVSEFRLHSLVRAETLLARLIALDPAQHNARRLLARVYISSGQATKALEALRPLLSADPPDAGTLALAGEAQLLAGRFEAAESHYARILEREPSAPTAMAVLAVGQLARGDERAGFAQLEEAARIDPGVAADMMLILERVRRSDFDGAARAVEALRSKHPEAALPHQLKGQLQAAAGDLEAAAASFERARQAEPRYHPALAALVQIDLSRGDRARARERLENARRDEPRNARVLLSLADIAAAERAPQDRVVAMLREAIAADTSDPTARVALVRYLESVRDAKASLAAAQEAGSAFPDHPEVLAALGRAQMFSGDTQQALATFARLASTFPGSPAGHLRLAEAQLALGERDSARASLRRALDVSPSDPQAWTMLISLEVQQRRFDDALRALRTHQRQHPKESLAHLLEGDVHAARKAWDAAATAYRSALRLGADPMTAYKLFGALRSGGRQRDAEVFAAGWGDSPNQRAALALLLGDDAMLGRDWARAERLYGQVLAHQPNLPRATNNLAMALIEQGRYPEARPHAERALAREPDNPAYLDTVGRILLQDGDTARALELQRRAVAGMEDDPHLRLQLARILIRAERRGDARAELERLTRLGGRFSEQEEVARLLATL